MQTIRRPAFPLVRRVARGGVEPPTFRFSGPGHCVRPESHRSLTRMNARTRPPMYGSERWRMRPRLRPPQRDWPAQPPCQLRSGRVDMRGELPGGLQVGGLDPSGASSSRLPRPTCFSANATMASR